MGGIYVKEVQCSIANVQNVGFNLGLNIPK